MKTKSIIFVGACFFSLALLFNLSGNDYSTTGQSLSAVAGSGGQCGTCQGFKLVNSTCGGKICITKPNYTCAVADQIPC